MKTLDRDIEYRLSLLDHTVSQLPEITGSGNVELVLDKKVASMVRIVKRRSGRSFGLTYIL